MIGLKINKLTVVDYAPDHLTDSGCIYSRVSCVCDCGNKVIVRKSTLKSGKLFSCGCLRRYKNREIKSHDMYGTQPYQIWFAMKNRCTNPSSDYYHLYGGRGITFCNKWIDFVGFWEDMSEGYSDELSLDRINNDSGYSKENCKWSSFSEQAYNQRKSKRNSTGKTGVHYDKTNGKFKVKFSKSNNVIVKYFDYMIDAIFYRMQLEQEYYGKVKE